MVKCNQRTDNDPGGCIFLCSDSHYQTFVRTLEDAEMHLASLEKKAS